MTRNARSTGSPAAQEAHEAQPKAPGDCSPAELHALAIVGKEAKKWRDSLTPGSYPVDLLVRLDGTVEVGEDQSRIETSKPELRDVLAYAFKLLGAKTRAKVAAAIVAHFSAANEGKAAEDCPPKAEILGLATTVVEQCVQRSMKTVRGNVTGKLRITRFPPPQPTDRQAA
jgi:hypothetical protein